MEENKEDLGLETTQNKEEKETFAPKNPEEETEEVKPNLAEEKSVEEILAEEKDRYIRLFAEFENYKKRTLKEKSDFFKYANQDLMISMLGVLDDFERAMKELKKTEKEEQLKGVELIYQKLKTKLQDKGLKIMEVNIGDSFNVDLHEAITQIPAPTQDLKGKIVDVVETGYVLSDRVIRFAKVIIGQ